MYIKLYINNFKKIQLFWIGMKQSKAHILVIRLSPKILAGYAEPP